MDLASASLGSGLRVPWPGRAVTLSPAPWSGQPVGSEGLNAGAYVEEND